MTNLNSNVAVELGEERPEWFDCSLDQIQQLTEGWENRLTLDNLTLSKRYLEGKLRVHVHMSRIDAGLVDEQYCAVFQGIHPISGANSNFHAGSMVEVLEEVRVGLSQNLPSIKAKRSVGLQAAGWANADQARRFAAYLRAGADADHYLEPDFDVQPLLTGLTMLALVLHRRDAAFPTVELARQVASNMADARFVLLEGSALLPFFGDTESVLVAIDEFLAETTDPARRDGLTEREQEILKLLAGGGSNEGIARLLSISTRTVERHIGNIYRKIDAHNRAEATAYAFRNGVVRPD